MGNEVPKGSRSSRGGTGWPACRSGLGRQAGMRHFSVLPNEVVQERLIHGKDCELVSQ